MWRRMVRAALLDAGVYRGIENEPAAAFQAFGVVILVGVAIGLGGGIAGLGGELPGPNLALLLVSAGLFAWLFWALTAYLIGTRLLRGPAGFRHLLRALGLAHSPGLLWVFIALGGGNIWQTAYAVTNVWILVTATIAVREVEKTGFFLALMIVGLGWFGSSFVRILILQG